MKAVSPSLIHHAWDGWIGYTSALNILTAFHKNSIKKAFTSYYPSIRGYNQKVKKVKGGNQTEKQVIWEYKFCLLHIKMSFTKKDIASFRRSLLHLFLKPVTSFTETCYTFFLKSVISFSYAYWQMPLLPLPPVCSRTAWYIRNNRDESVHSRDP